MRLNQTAIKNQSLFSIIGLADECYYSKISVDFTAPFNLNKASNSIVPTFFKDKNYFTPGFILPRQKEYYSQNTQFQRTYFEQRVMKANTLFKQLEEENMQSEDLGQIVPNIKYCQICQTNFDSYFQHIKDCLHVTKSKQCNANQYIQILCKQYQENQSRARLHQKRKPIQKQKKKTKQLNKECRKASRKIKVTKYKKK